MACVTASSVGVVKVDNMELAVMLAWYQVTSTPAQLALVAARSLRDAVAASKVYSLYDQETWVIPKYWKPPLPWAPADGSQNAAHPSASIRRLIWTLLCASGTNWPR